MIVVSKLYYICNEYRHWDFLLYTWGAIHNSPQHLALASTSPHGQQRSPVCGILRRGEEGRKEGGSLTFLHMPPFRSLGILLESLHTHLAVSQRCFHIGGGGAGAASQLRVCSWQVTHLGDAWCGRDADTPWVDTMQACSTYEAHKMVREPRLAHPITTQKYSSTHDELVATYWVQHQRLFNFAIGKLLVAFTYRNIKHASLTIGYTNIANIAQITVCISSQESWDPLVDRYQGAWRCCCLQPSTTNRCIIIRCQWCLICEVRLKFY